MMDIFYAVALAPLLLFIFFISHGFNFYANLDKSASRAS